MTDLRIKTIDLFGRTIDDPAVLGMIPNATGYGSHRVLLALALAWFDPKGLRAPRPNCVYEFGMGEGSTPYIAAFCSAHGVNRACFESDPSWFARYFEPGYISGNVLGGFRANDGKTTIINGYAGWDSIPIESLPARGIDVALVDHAPGQRRKVEIERLREKATFVVVHDTEKDGCGDYQVEDALSSYKFRLDDHPGGAGTTIVSNYIGVSSEPFVIGLLRLRSLAAISSG